MRFETYPRPRPLTPRWLASRLPHPRALAAAVVPPVCLECARPNRGDALLCPQCELVLGALPHGDFLYGQWFRERHAPLQERYSAFPFEGPARTLVHALKYRGAAFASREMGNWIYSRALAHYQGDDLIVPVPSHPAHLRERGYNSAGLIAKRLGKLIGIPVCDCLERVGARPPQTLLERSERLELSAADLRLKPRRRGARWSVESPSVGWVLVVDDVVTTGVTLNACASVIREVTSADIKAVTFASTGAHPGGVPQGLTG